MAFENGEKVVYRYIRNGKTVLRKGVFVRNIKSPYANKELCLIIYCGSKSMTYAMTGQLIKV
jgi:hypothetical protein